MAISFTRLQSRVRDVRWSMPAELASQKKPVVVLLHGLGGDRNDWMNPFQDRNWPYDHRSSPKAVELGAHSSPPIAKLPGLDTKYFFSPRLGSNTHGRDGSDDRSWWNALTRQGFPTLTYSQVPELMMPLSRGPVAELKGFMELLQQDVLSDPALRPRQVVIVGHSRGGLIGRAYLGDPDVKGDRSGRFPQVTGLITISSPHLGSQMALLDDRIIGFLEKIQDKLPGLPNDAGNQLINTIKAKVDAYVGQYGDEIEPASPMYRALEAQEPIRAGVRCISVGGTSPRFLRIYLWAFTPDSLLPKKNEAGKTEFRWRAAPLEAKVASPVPDGLPLKVLGLELDEVLPGRGDGMTADKRCRFPASFKAEEHLSYPLSHAEELWDDDLQKAVVARLGTFQ